ncbi:6-phospho-3-hexuloisomerase [Salinicoccus halodurans]|uniref:3-hexulose-6-phosphate isomerase n=1 Tax=Salinicoccus halodurans TaxID=407035 RepID=A0A0F7HLC5_9STAP|nr:6-phospho-3-hexuloisomerase [Salinicoccus halodurans]AKG73917.1 6-phospho 3-hexuloisomerase [Salinicoccus halodurans]SFK57741.1 3-hexulose-6-phosphate isomerase [Salinicoccus halodurans]
MDNYKLIINEIEQTLGQVPVEKTERLKDMLLNDSALFIAAKGRSGLVGQGFAMRLNQLGQKVYVAGGTLTPSIQEKDVLLVISASGTTEHLQLLAKKADSVGAEIVLITTTDDAPIKDLSSLSIQLPAGTKYDEAGSQQPLGTLFEQSCQIFLDSMVMDLKKKLNVTEKTMQDNHANLE